MLDDTSRLRSWIHKYGNLGVFMVACYLDLYHLWTARRRIVVVSLAGVGLSIFLFFPHETQHLVPAPSPHAALSPVSLPGSPSKVQEPAAKDELQRTRIVHAGHDLWRLEIWWPHQGVDIGEYIKFFRNGHLVRKIYARDIGGVGLGFGEAKFKTRFPMIVLQTEPECGHPGPTCLYTIRQGRLIQMGQVGGEYGGPIFRDYDGDGRPEWVFDDYNWYNYYDKGPKYFLVYKEWKNGTLHLWKRLPNVHRRPLPANFVQEDWRT